MISCFYARLQRQHIYCRNNPNSSLFYSGPRAFVSTAKEAQRRAGTIFSHNNLSSSWSLTPSLCGQQKRLASCGTFWFDVFVVRHSWVIPRAVVTAEIGDCCPVFGGFEGCFEVNIGSRATCCALAKPPHRSGRFQSGRRACNRPLLRIRQQQRSKRGTIIELRSTGSACRGSPYGK